MMDLRDLFAAPVQNAPKKKTTKPQTEQFHIPPTAPKTSKTSTSSVSSDHSRGSNGNSKPNKPKRAASNRTQKRPSNLSAGPVPYNGASNFTTLEELSRKRVETSDWDSDVEQQEDDASESSVVSQQRDDERDDDVENFEYDDTQSVRSGTSARSVKSAGTKSVCSARSATSGKETKVRKGSQKTKSVALIYEEY